METESPGLVGAEKNVYNSGGDLVQKGGKSVKKVQSGGSVSR